MKRSELKSIVTFKNYTPHRVTVYTPCEKDGVKSFSPTRIFFPIKGADVRVREYITEQDSVGEFRYVKKEYCDVQGLPPKEWGVILIVSVIVLQACPERDDLMCPDTGPDSAVRDEDGKILGVKRFQM